MNGEEISEEEAINLIYLSEKSNKFSVKQYLLALFYHTLATFFTMPGASMMMYVFEGGDWNLSYNL